MTDTLLALFGGVPLAGATAFFAWLTVKGTNAKRDAAKAREAEAAEDKARAAILEQDRLRMESMLNAYRTEIERLGLRASNAERAIDRAESREQREAERCAQLEAELDFAHTQIRALTGSRPARQSAGGGDESEGTT